MSAAEIKAVFLSYASQDAEAALRLGAGLRAAGVEVWLDQEGGLVGGDAWDRKIREQIASCALFVPLISANTQARKEGYFRLEWKLAAQRTHMMSESVAFLLPVVIDATRDAEADVPTEFRAVQWTRLRPAVRDYAGQARPEPALEAFCARVKTLLSPPAVAGVAEPGPASPRPATSKTSVRRPWLVPAVLALAALAAVALWQPWKAKALAGPDDKSIAVLPFTNLSDDKENTAFFSDGMHEDILTTLANIPELRVISRTSVMEYRGTTKKIPQIARELNVAYILEGSVRRAGNQVRLTGQLIRAAKDEHLWAKHYDRELTPKDMFAIQATLATEIAGALQAAISPAAKKLVERRPTENLAAYDLYLKARSLRIWVQSEAQDRERLLQEAVGLDPDFAAAWSELAANHAGFMNFAWDNTPRRLAQADTAMDRAVRLAPDAPEVILNLGKCAMLGYRDFARAITHCEKFIQLQPKNAEGYFNMGIARVRQGNWPEALGNFRKQVELEPVAPSLVWLRYTLQAGRRWDEAIGVQRRYVALADSLAARWSLARLIFAATGSTTEMDKVVAQLTATERDSAIFRQKELAMFKGDFAEWKRLDSLPEEAVSESRMLDRKVSAALVLAAHGDQAGARARLGNWPAAVRSDVESQRELQPDNALKWSRLALMEALLGDHASALRDARKALELEPDTKDTLVGPRLRLNLAKVLAWSGDKDRAIAELAHVLSVPWRTGVTLSVHTLRVDPDFAPLRGHPAFERLLKDPKNHAPLF